MTPETDDPKQDGRLIVWDLPLRLFHWGLAAAVIISVVSVNMGRMDIHERSGLTVLALVAFRIIWGFGGGHHARFANFVRSPVAVVGWLRATRAAACSARLRWRAPSSWRTTCSWSPLQSRLAPHAGCRTVRGGHRAADIQPLMSVSIVSTHMHDFEFAFWCLCLN